MRTKSFLDLMSMTEAVEAATSARELSEILLKLTNCFGVEKILSGLMPKPGSSATEQMSGILLADWPDEWARRYFFKDYLFVDPTIDWVNTQTRPVQWRELTARVDDKSPARRVMNEAAEFGLADGLTVPVVASDGLRVGISFAGHKIELSEVEQNNLGFLAPTPC